jgi:hypothetical protein
MPEPNTNRELDADQVVQLFAKNVPHLVKGLGADRSWLWWAGPKPEDRDRAKLMELGFQFTPKPHTLQDGREAHWFHACGGLVMRRRRSGDRREVSTRQQSKLDKKSSRAADNGSRLKRTQVVDNSLDALERLAAELP